VFNGWLVDFSGLVVKSGRADRALDTGHLSQNGFCGVAVIEGSVDSELVVQVLALPGLRVHEGCSACANHGPGRAAGDVPDATNRCAGSSFAWHIAVLPRNPARAMVLWICIPQHKF
tara:strand:+ start:260 stop:610 length:351 start_codon:yes stop_codon:yes gene_type:complete